MKKTLTSLILFSIISTSAFAGMEIVNCDSIRGTNQAISLIVVNQDIKQVRILNPASNRPHALLASKLNVQNIPNITLYRLMGLPTLMKVDNKVLEGNGGLVSFGSDEFSCF